MTEADPKANILGHFTVQGVDHAGALKLDGTTTELQIYSEDFFHLKTEEMACVRGVSNEGVSISALHCVPLTLSPPITASTATIWSCAPISWRSALVTSSRPNASSRRSRLVFRTRIISSMIGELSGAFSRIASFRSDNVGKYFVE